MESNLRRRRICSSVFWAILLCVILFITIFGSTAVLGDGGENYRMENNRINAPEKPSRWEMTKNAFSLYTSPPLRVPTYSEKVKTLFNQVQAYFFPPSIDFRGRTCVEGEAGGGGGGAGEKVKEVVGKSFGTSKLTVEDSAKSAAKLVGDTVQKTKEKVKRSFSDRENRESTATPSEL